MNNKKNVFSLVLSVILCFVFVACASSKKIDDIPEPPVVEVDDSVFEPIKSLADLSGTWISSDGFLYEYPFVLNGKNYLRHASPVLDDTAKWTRLASYYFTTLDNLWERRFSHLNEIYGEEYPLSDENGIEIGVKLSYKSGKVTRRIEMLFPEEVVRRNINFYWTSKKGELKENGTFNFGSSNPRIPKTSNGDGQVYVRHTDYWR